MKKIFRKIHLWLSIPFGILITLICFSGAMLVFEKEITQMANHSLFYVDKIERERLPLDKLAEIVSSTLPDSIHVTGINVFPEAERTYQVNLSKPRKASIYIDPYTGKIKGKYERLPFFSTMFKMHRWMMGSAKADDGSIGLGKLVVGISTIMFVFILITGAIIWWPRNIKILKNHISIKVSKGWRRFLYDFHVAGGIYALLLLLAMSLTGLTWSFQWYRNGVYTLFGVETTHSSTHNNQQEKTNKERKIKREKENKFAFWQKVFDEVAEKNPQFKQITVTKGSVTVSFNQFGNQRASDKYSFDTKSGEITEVSLYKEQPDTGKIRGWIYSVHVGSWGGLFTRILTFLAALLGATLPLTGYYLWIKKLYNRK